MTAEKLIFYPAENLRRTSRNITSFTSELRLFAERMNIIMNEYEGVGLAAPQVGHNVKLIIVKVEQTDTFRILINPEITFSSRKVSAMEEGCLSLPGIYGYVERPVKIRYRYQDVSGVEHKDKATGFESIVLQHEIDHINGRLILDRKIELTKGRHLLLEGDAKKHT
jgi:peptide deformylase